jgi:hypothetical protein
LPAREKRSKEKSLAGPQRELFRIIFIQVHNPYRAPVTAITLHPAALASWTKK